MGGGALLEETAASLLGPAYLTPQLEGALQVGDLDGFVAHLTLQRRRIPLHILNQLEEILHPHLEADYAELLAEIARDPGKCLSDGPFFGYAPSFPRMVSRLTPRPSPLWPAVSRISSPKGLRTLLLTLGTRGKGSSRVDYFSPKLGGRPALAQALQQEMRDWGQVHTAQPSSCPLNTQYHFAADQTSPRPPHLCMYLHLLPPLLRP